MEWNFLNQIKGICEKSGSTIILNYEKPNVFPLKTERKQGFRLSTLLLNIVLEVLVSTIRQETAKKRERKEKASR